MTPHGPARLAVFVVCIVLCGCSSAPTPDPSQTSCAALSSTSLTHYDQMSSAFLDDATRHPTDNLSGEVAWNTRYYLESLLTAYEATGNQKYTQAFLDSGAWVMNLLQTIPVMNAPDATAPGASGPTINATGWPTILGNYGTAVPIPTADGKTSLYAQNLTPAGDGVLSYFQVTQQSDGSLQLAWLGPSAQVLQSASVATRSDLESFAAQPLTWNEETGQSYGRVILTGAGLPAPGQYLLTTPFAPTVFHEQTGGILIPFVRFLLFAKEHPEIADSATLAQWTSQIVAVAASYENQFISDNAGGLRFVNPQWLPNSAAGIDAPADYIFMEARFRLLLYLVTGDSTQLSIARGLVSHQQMFHWQTNSTGWLALKVWPCVISWTTRASAATGSLWDSFQYDPTTPAPATDASFVADFLQTAQHYGLVSQLGIDAASYEHQQAAFTAYMLHGPSAALVGPQGVMRANFPTETSTKNDPVVYSVDPYAAAAWTPNELSEALFSSVYWNWIMQYGSAPQNEPIGYFLRAWARSEASQLSVCAAHKQ